MNKFFQLFVNNKAFRNILLLVLVPFFIVFLASIFLRFYTHHGQKISVPDFSALSMEDAQKLAKQKNLQLVINDSVFLQDRQSGSIIDQNPRSGYKAKSGRKIYVTIVAFAPEMVEMPDIINYTYKEAKTIIESRGLQVGNLRYVADISDRIKQQKFKNKNIKPKDLLAKGSRIDLVVGRISGNESTNVPDVLSLKLHAAKQYLSDNSLNLGAVVYDKSIVDAADSANAIIIKQNPVPGNTINLGSFVDVWLSISENE